MKRDWNLIRKILTIVEDGRIQELEPYDIPIYNHCKLLKESGYINFERRNGLKETPTYFSGWLTWKGHDLLEYLGNGITIVELEDMDIPITEHTLKKYAEFLLEKELFEEEEIDD